MQMPSPGPSSPVSVLSPLPLAGYSGKRTRWKLLERQRGAVGESWRGPWAVPRSWRSWGKGSWHCSDSGSQRLPSPHRGQCLSGGTCIWHRGSPGLLQTQNPRQRSAVSQAPYWFSAHLPQWCQEISDCQALCIQHRGWGWSPDAVSPKTQGEEKVSESLRMETTPNRNNEEDRTPGNFVPHMSPQTLGWGWFPSSLMDTYKDPDDTKVNNVWYSSQPIFWAVPFTCTYQCWS